MCSPNPTNAQDAMQKQQVNTTAASAAAGIPTTMNTGIAQPHVQHGQSVVPGGATVDVASILAKVQQLEEANKLLQSQHAAANAQLSKFKEGKRAEMEALLNSTIAKWLEQLETKDAESKKSLEAGLKALAQDGNESGVWEVVACASSNWQTNVNEIENLRNKLNTYEEREKELTASGVFSKEDNRIDTTSSGTKRKADEISPTEQNGTQDIWAEFQGMLMGKGGNSGDNFLGGTSQSLNILESLNPGGRY